MVVRDWTIRAGICQTSVIAEGSKEQETTMSSNVDFEASTLQLPSHQQLANHFKLRRTKSFSKCVSLLLGRLDVFCYDSFINSNVRSEEVALEA